MTNLCLMVGALVVSIRRNSTVRFNPNVKGRNTYFQNGKGGKKNHETDQFTTRSRYNDRVVIRSVSLRPHLLQKSRLNGLPQLPSKKDQCVVSLTVQLPHNPQTSVPACKNPNPRSSHPHTRPLEQGKTTAGVQSSLHCRWRGGGD